MSHKYNQEQKTKIAIIFEKMDVNDKIRALVISWKINSKLSNPC